jgi:MFS family permease
MALWGVAGAAIQALMTRLVAPDQQGQLQGATSSVQSLSQLFGPFLFSLTFAYFIRRRRSNCPARRSSWRRRYCCWRSR